MPKLFVSENCFACKQLMEVIKKNKLECNLEIIDVEKNPELADKYNVKAVPWVIDEDGKDMDGEVFARKCNIIDIK